MQTKEEQLMEAFKLLDRPAKLIVTGIAALLSETEESFRRQIQVFLQNPAFQEPKKND